MILYIISICDYYAILISLLGLAHTGIILPLARDRQHGRSAFWQNELPSFFNEINGW